VDNGNASLRLPIILIVDDEPMMLRLLGGILAARADIRLSTGGEDASALVRECTPDLILLDAEMPGMNGSELFRRIKSDPEIPDIPVVFVTNHHDPDFEAACFELGAVDYIHKPVKAPVLLARVGMQLRLRELTDELRQVARTDAVTQCASRRMFDERIQEEWTRMRRHGRPLSLALLDLDHFKTFNDHYGHQAGDDCLRVFGRLLQRVAARASDVVARYGGEEFAVLLPETDIAGAQAVAENLLTLLRDARIPHASSPLSKQVSASIGLSTFQPTAAFIGRRTDPPPAGLPGPADLVAAADKALYEAKRAGRAQARFVAVELVGVNELDKSSHMHINPR
jgi:diguanylate cyclase (GGDEF)-like protein